MNRRFFFDAIVATTLVAMCAAGAVPQIPKQNAGNPESDMVCNKMGKILPTE
jgi:hypothetical protein